MDNLVASNKSTKSISTQMASIDKEIAKLDGEVKVINDSLNAKNEKLKALDLQVLGLQTNQDVAKEIGPLKYIAKLTGKTLDQVVNYFIIALMLVFDPLAISLVIASNFLFSSLNGKKTAVPQDQEESQKDEKEEEKKDDEDFLWDDDLSLPFDVIDEDYYEEEEPEEQPIEQIPEPPPAPEYIQEVHRDPTLLR
jgi:hypothetical protein